MIVVIGGGLAGLTCARALHRNGYPVTLVEAAAEVGGRVRTVRHPDGFTLDVGFQALWTAYPSARRHLDVPALQPQRFLAGAIIIDAGVRFQIVDPLRRPERLLEMGASTLIPFQDKVRLLALRLALLRKTDDQIFAGPDATVEAFLKGWGFSDLFLHRFAQPLCGALFFDRTLQTSAALFQWLFKMLLGGDLVLPAGGMGRVSHQLAEGLPAASLRLGTCVEALQAEDEPQAGWRVRTTGGDIEATAVIVATEAPAAARLTGLPLSVPEGTACTTAYFAGPVSLYSDPVIVLNAALDGFISEFVQVTNVAPSYAPPGQHLYAATILGVPELSDTEIADRCLAEIGAWFGPWVRNDLRLLQVFRIPFAQFRQPPGFFQALPVAETSRRGLFLAGEYCRYSNIEGAIASGEAAALRVMQTYLLGLPTSTA